MDDGVSIFHVGTNIQFQLLNKRSTITVRRTRPWKTQSFLAVGAIMSLFSPGRHIRTLQATSKRWIQMSGGQFINMGQVRQGALLFSRGSNFSCVFLSIPVPNESVK